MALRSIIRSPLSSSVASAVGVAPTLLQIATARNGGIAPLHFFDFASNRALFNSADVGAISQIQNLTGTLNLVAGVGQRVASASNILKVTSPGISYPFTLAAKFTRTTDTGGGEQLVFASAGGNSQNISSITVAVADTGRAVMTTANISQGNANVATVLATGTPYKLAGRFAANDMHAALGGVLSAAPVTSLTLPTTPDAINIGGTVLGAQFLVGDIEYVSIFSGALSNAQLQTVTT